MAEQAKCPKCGAQVHHVHTTSSLRKRNVYECGRDEGGSANVPCLERQLAANEAKIVKLKDEIKRLEINLVLMAKLAADPPQFNSPITLVGAKAVRDRILKGER